MNRSLKIETQHTTDLSVPGSGQKGPVAEICPSCGYCSEPPQRPICGQCGYLFVLDVRKGTLISDKEWFDLTSQATRNGTRFISSDRLYAFFCEGWRNDHPPAKPLSVLLLLAAAVLFWLDQQVLVLFAILGALTSWFVPRHKTPSQAWFQEICQRMTRAGRHSPMVIDTRSCLDLPTLHDSSQSHDSIKQILILQRQIQVDLFLLNGFHLDGQTLILSAGGYPQLHLDLAERFLNECPELPVFLIHDASLKGSRMMTFLQQSDFLPLGGHPIYDLGLSEEQAFDMKVFKNLGRRNDEVRPFDMIDQDMLFLAISEAMTSQNPVASFESRIKRINS